jgi:hypothetical protein
VGHLIAALIEHMADEVNVTVTHPQLGLQGRVVGKGLGLVLKNVVKYL